MTDRPFEIISLDDLQNYYWTKSDLMQFCKNHGLSIQGAKSDLIKKIEIYLTNGNRINYVPVKKQKEKDSLNQITKNTLVKNYNNDAETRKFFVEHLGKKFKFNAYLRQFTNPSNIDLNMTYDDLVNGWISFEKSRKSLSKKNIIPSQFEYNQFIKDYFSNEKSATLKSAISAWKILVSKKGPRTYEQFKKNSDTI